MHCKMFAIEWLLFYVKTEDTHDAECVATLHKCIVDLRDESGPFCGTCQTSSGDENQFTFVNVENFVEFDLEVEEDPLSSTSAIIQPEPLVSCVCPCNA